MNTYTITYDRTANPAAPYAVTINGEVVTHVACYLDGQAVIDAHTPPATPKPKRTRKTRRKIACLCPNCTPTAHDEPSGVYRCREGSEWHIYDSGHYLGSSDVFLVAQNTLDALRYEALQRG